MRSKRILLSFSYSILIHNLKKLIATCVLLEQFISGHNSSKAEDAGSVFVFGGDVLWVRL